MLAAATVLLHGPVPSTGEAPVQVARRSPGLLHCGVGEVASGRTPVPSSRNRKSPRLPTLARSPNLADLVPRPNGAPFWFCVIRLTSAA